MEFCTNSNGNFSLISETGYSTQYRTAGRERRMNVGEIAIKNEFTYIKSRGAGVRYKLAFVCIFGRLEFSSVE